MEYTNTSNIPLPLAVFLATDSYDHQPNTISATSLLKPVRQLILSSRTTSEDLLIDISSMVSSRMGTAIHTAIEQAWTNPSKALKRLGYSDDVINRIKINPTEVKDNDIPIYMEQRSFKEIDGYTISGKYDFVAEGRVQDFKSTSVYTYLNQTNADKYVLQGSIYRWLNPDIITKDILDIHYIFTDWNKKDSLTNKDYPPNRVHTQKFKLKSISETEAWVKNKLSELKKYELVSEDQLPLCTDEDLWRKPTIYKYYKNPKSARSTKNFNNLHEAMDRLTQDGSVGEVKEIKGQVAACKYCPAFSICTQKDMLIEKGELIL
ncbi:hypothetical protein ACF3N0_00295 [Moraxella atlantae]|uniref:hypothetical protein n=1 Tax=Faucicola atlantae TaxID=34059 RepID=UPI0037519F6A